MAPIRRLAAALVGLLPLLLPAAAQAAPARAASPAFEITLPGSFTEGPQDGILLLIFAPADQSPDKEPRELVNWDGSAIPFYGLDVEGWAPGTARRIDDRAFGFPVRQLRDLPPDQGEGQQWRAKPGNLFSQPVALRWDGRRVTSPAAGARALTDALALTEKIPPVEPFQETDWVKHVRIRSERLSKFWGRDIYLAAFVTLPQGFRETPPDPDLEPDYSTRFQLAGYNRIQRVEIQHPTPFYDDSYGVNSANNGPYGDAIQYELIPEIERRFRGIGQGWARFVYGGSTGGWIAMAVQMFYPDEYNGAWVACPDPIDFRHYMTVNLYEDRNAYWMPNRFKRTPRPAHRNWLGHVDTTIEENNLWELALGTRGRSGDQWDVWESVYSPIGPDGYPRRIWDRLTGEIDPVTAAYWRENYDLSHILRRDWPTLSPKLRGKLRLYAGDMDNHYLNNAVYAVEEFLRSAQPAADAVIDYGDRAEHCWNGDHTRSNAYSRLRYPQMVLPWAVERMIMTAPKGADVRSWRY